MWAAYIKKEFPKKSLGKRGQLRMLHGADITKLMGVPYERLSQYVILDDVENFVSRFRFSERDNFHSVIISRGGAIGDIVMLSNPIARLIDMGFNVSLVTDKDVFGVVKWFEKVPKIKDYNGPVLEKFKPRSEEAKKISHINILGTIELGQRENWFEIVFKQMEWPFVPAYGRPRLTTTRLPGRKVLHDNSLLFTLKSTDTRRTMAIWTAYTCALNAGLDKKYEFFIHDVNLNILERYWIGKENPKITIIPKTTRDDALLDFYDASMLVSIDTGSLHFREGVQRPGIGLYSAFGTDSRTKYYVHTRSYDLKYPCDKQPCFEHGNVNGLYCNLNEDKSFHSVCLRGEIIEKQLTEIFETI